MSVLTNPADLESPQSEVVPVASSAAPPDFSATNVDHRTKSDVLSQRDKPQLPPIDVDAMPPELKAVNRWLGWKWHLNVKSGKWTKIPIDARSGQYGSSTDSTTWCSFQEAMAGVEAGRCDGIGIALGESDGIHIAGTDLDDCRNPETGELSEVAQNIIGKLDTYCEVSPTGTGVKLISIGDLPPGSKTKNKAGTVEIYSSDRYFTITGQHVVGTPKRIEHRQRELREVWEEYIGSERVVPNCEIGNDTPARQEHDVDRTFEALDAMLLNKPAENENDGSRRLFVVACRAVEHNLSDELALITIRSYERKYPFPTSVMRHSSIETTRRYYATGNVQKSGGRLRAKLPNVPRYGLPSANETGTATTDTTPQSQTI